MSTRCNLIPSTSPIELPARQMGEAIVIARSSYNLERLICASRFSDAPASLGTATPYRATVYPWLGSVARPGRVNRACTHRELVLPPPPGRIPVLASPQTDSSPLPEDCDTIGLLPATNQNTENTNSGFCGLHPHWLELDHRRLPPTSASTSVSGSCSFSCVRFRAPSRLRGFRSVFWPSRTRRSAPCVVLDSSLSP